MTAARCRAGPARTGRAAGRGWGRAVRTGAVPVPGGGPAGRSDHNREQNLHPYKKRRDRELTVKKSAGPGTYPAGQPDGRGAYSIRGVRPGSSVSGRVPGAIGATGIGGYRPLSGLCHETASEMARDGDSVGNGFGQIASASGTRLAARGGGVRPVRSRVRHGSPSCASYGCTRPECRAAARRDRVRRDRELRAGRPARVSASEAASRARVLRDAGWSAGDIAAVSGVSVTLVRRLLRLPTDQQPHIHRAIAEAILGVPLVGIPGRLRHPGLVPSTVSAGCLQELAERGWPTSFLATRLRTSTQTLAAIRNGKRPRITLVLDQGIQHCHRELAESAPAEYGIAVHRSRRASMTARQRARRPSVTSYTATS